MANSGIEQQPVELVSNKTEANSVVTERAKQNQQAVLWDSCFENKTPSYRYAKTAVLMISWGESDIDTSSEVNELAEVFKDDYGFVVEQESILRENPQKQIRKRLLTFIGDHDDEGTLLILYYAGHGWYGPRTEKNFMLLPMSNRSKQENLLQNSIAWFNAEKYLNLAEQDIFAIFDCCDAGHLCNYRGPLRFEYLGACCEDQTTRAPGIQSFTSALIWALRKLKKEKPDGFNTSQLHKKITDYEHFPDDQAPRLGFPSESSARRDHIVLSPATANRDIPTKRNDESQFELYWLEVRFHFRRPPGTAEITKTATHLDKSIRSGEINAERATYLRTGVDSRVKVAQHWEGLWRKRIDRQKTFFDRWQQKSLHKSPELKQPPTPERSNQQTDTEGDTSPASSSPTATTTPLHPSMLKIELPIPLSAGVSHSPSTADGTGSLGKKRNRNGDDDPVTLQAKRHRKSY